MRTVLLFILLVLCHVSTSAAQESTVQTEKTQTEKAQAALAKKSSVLEKNVQLEKTPVVKADEPEVGKHVMANMDATSMVVSLLMVLAVIIASAFLLKRFQIVQQGGGQLKVVANLSLGAKERVVIVQVGEQQLVLGVTSQQITLIEKLSEPLIKSASAGAENQSLPSHNVTASVLRFLKKSK